MAKTEEMVRIRAAMTVPCPKCRAPIGVRCRSGTGRLANHARRWVAAGVE